MVEIWEAGEWAEGGKGRVVVSQRKGGKGKEEMKDTWMM